MRKADPYFNLVVKHWSNIVKLYRMFEEKQPVIGTSRLMMMVSAKDFQLKQWTVTDPQGYDTTVAVSNLDSKSRPDPSMFKIDFTRNLQ